MVKKTKPKKDYGYYCDLCGNQICKYQLDFKLCGGYYIGVSHKKPKKQNIEYVEICYDCLKAVMEEGVDSL